MLIKVVRADGTKSETYECMHYTVERVTPSSPAAALGLREPGVTIEVGRKAPNTPSGPTLMLAVGDIAYIMNEKGDTVDSYRVDTKEADNAEAIPNT